MRRILVLVILLIAKVQSNAQTAIETLVGNRQVHYINYWQKDLDSAAKWNFFNLNRFTANYGDKSLNTVSIEGQLTYQFKPWLGVSVGGGYYGELFIPTIGLSLSYMNKKQDFFAQIYPTVGLAEGYIVPSTLGLIGYNPKINDKWGFSSQLLFSLDPIELAQIIRIGADYKSKIQFGMGFDVTKAFETKKTYFNIGPFLRFNIL